MLKLTLHYRFGHLKILSEYGKRFSILKTPKCALARRFDNRPKVIRMEMKTETEIKMKILLKNISDTELLSKTKKLVMKERELIGEIIVHLAEIETRKLYCDLKYHSLYDYCTEELGYTSDQAYRRISAMRLSKQLPQVKEKLENGTISLSSANLLSVLIKDSKMEKAEQVEVLNLIEGKSKRETAALIENIRSEKQLPTPAKKKTVIKQTEGAEDIRLSVSISKETLAKIEQVRNLYSKKSSGNQPLDLDKVLDMMAQAALEKHKEELAPKRELKKKNNKEESKEINRKSRYISKQTKYYVYKKADGRCELCGSTKNLQYDHLNPHAKGGSSEESNIRLLCSNCNLRAGILEFGVKKMRRESGANITNKKEFVLGRNERHKDLLA